MGYHGSTQQSEVNSSSISWGPVAQNQNFVLSSSLNVSNIGEFCALQPAPCALSQTSWGHGNTVKQTILDSWTTLAWYWYPYQATWLFVTYNLQLSLKQKFRSPPKDSIMQLSISFIALAVGKDFAFSICSSIILRSKPLSSYGYETKQEFQSLVSTCELFERKTETDSDFGGDTVIHLEMWSALSSEHTISPWSQLPTSKQP